MKIRLIDFGLPVGFEPKRAHDNDVGADVYSTGTYVIPPNTIAKIPLGFGLKVPVGLAGFIFPRSSLSAAGIICELPPIDPGYRGEIHAIISNVSKTTYKINKGDRIGQLVIMPALTPEFTRDSSDERGAGAFGSTGK